MRRRRALRLCLTIIYSLNSCALTSGKRAWLACGCESSGFLLAFAQRPLGSGWLPFPLSHVLRCSIFRWVGPWCPRFVLRSLPQRRNSPPSLALRYGCFKCSFYRVNVRGRALHRVKCWLLRVVTMSSVRFIEVDAEFAGQRLDNFLMARAKGVPKSLIYRVIRKGEVRVNKGRAKPERKLEAGDIVRVPPMQTKEAPVINVSDSLKQALIDAIIWDQDGLIIINKPAGIAVHGGSGVSVGLIEALREALKAPHLELVHRLDRDTSGCVMVARKRSMLKYLQDALRQKGVIQKHYLAIAHGRWPKHLAVVDVPLKRCEYPNGERIVRVQSDGKPSVTEFRVIQSNESVSLLAAKPLTGRTHQIRVHALHAGHALVADSKYASDDLNKAIKQKGFKRLGLHAHRLEFTLPDGKLCDVRAPLPGDLAEPLTNMGVMLDEVLA